MNAWAAAAYLVERGVPSRLAHEAVGKAVTAVRGARMRIAETAARRPAGDPSGFSTMSWHKALTLDAVISIHDVKGERRRDP